MEGKYSLIFMFDSGKTICWRVGPTMLRLLVAVLILLPLLAAGSLWLNWKLFDDRRSVLVENALLRHDVEVNAQTVARLSSLEKFLMQNAPGSLEDLVASASVPLSDENSLSKAPASTNETLELAAQPASPANASALSDMESSPPSGGQPEPEMPQAAPASAEKASSLPEASGKPETSEDAADVEADPSGFEAVLDKGFARVENLVARRVGARSLRISFDLFNTEQLPQLSGKTTFELILKDGSTYQLAPHGDTTYRINRLKKIVGNPMLPPELNDVEGASVRVSLYTNEDIIYQIVTPIR